MLRFDNIIYGPVHSRRLGVSLGVNLLPSDGKICNFDCVYCECGWNRDGRTSSAMPSPEMVGDQLRAVLSSMKREGKGLDVITFAGHGEPTLHPAFPSIVDLVLELRNEFFPDAAVSVLSNSTTLERPGVFQTLLKVDNPIMKLDAPTPELIARINRPNTAFDMDAVISNLERFDGDFIMQTMFLGGCSPDYRSDGTAYEKWCAIVRHLHPRQVMVYSLDRPAPMEGLEKLDAQTMRSLLEPLINEGYNIQIN